MPFTEVQLRQGKPGDKPRRLSDECGLYVEIRTRGRKLWRCCYEMEF